MRLVGEQHVREDLGSIPSFADWARLIAPQAWMMRGHPLDEATAVNNGDANLGGVLANAALPDARARSMRIAI